MKKILTNRVLPVLCAFSIFISSCVVSASAVGFSDYDSVDAWTAQFNNITALASSTLLDAYCLCSGLPLDTEPVDIIWALFNTAISQTGEVTLARLYEICDIYNSYFNLPTENAPYSFKEYLGNVGRRTVSGLLGLGILSFEVEEHPSSGLMRIKETTHNIWVVNSAGLYPYTEVKSDGTTVAGDQWIGEVTASDRATSGSVALQSLDRLNLICVQLKEEGIPVQIKTLGSKYKGIWYNRQFYADPYGNPYVAQVDDSQWAINQDRPDTVVKDEDGNVIQIEGDINDNSTSIDLSGMTITLPDGKVMIADNIIYDESTKTYNIDSHDTYNTEINYYYSWTYHINYTSITYIGQTEEYNKYYEVYYELPDGRDSADLTAEEVEQLNVSIDVVPYGRTVDDINLRSLYHFDGDTEDSSYWNYCTDFIWNKGASLTYMDAGVFKGALYLDELEHEFTVVLNDLLGSGDSSIQFRYYQSYTAAPVTDSYISIGSTKVLQMNGASFLDASGNVLSSTPIGSWSEIALVRSNGVLYIYLNGIVIGQTSNAAILSDRITFHFGTEQQTYKYFDELRVQTVALAANGAAYDCTSVPFDTNLALVLPDSVTAIADEYYSFTESDGLLEAFDFTQEDISEFFDFSAKDGYTPPFALYEQDKSYTYSVSQTNKGLILSRVAGGGNYTYGGFYLSRASLASRYGVTKFDLVFYFNDCSYVVFHMTKTSGDTVTYDNYGAKFSFNQSGSSNSYFALKPKSGESSVCITRVEVLTSGSTPSTMELVSNITAIDKDAMNTPTLAVRTDLDITSYQIGGVRPSLPKKGQVWALVERERITSVQIYNGSAWEACDGRIWTGERWVPAGSYNIITLQDMYDIVDATPNYEYIYTETGFWSWWQKAWITFTDKLFSTLGTGSGGSGGPSTAPTSVKQALAAALSALIESLFAVITTVLQSLLGLVTDMLSFFFNFLTDTVLGGIKSFFSIFTDGSLTEWFQQTGEDGSTTIGLPSEIITAFSFISGVIMLLPSELRGILFFGIGLMLLMSVFKLVKE